VPAAELAAVVFTHLHQDHCRGATWSGRLTFPEAAGFAHTAEIAFWSGAQAAGAAADEHLTSAREAIRLFGSRLRPFGHDTEILPGWGTPWDHDTAQAVRARHRLLNRAADEHLLVHAYHMPFPGLGTIARNGDAYKWQPLRHD
jgi:hypothetical protein